MQLFQFQKIVNNPYLSFKKRADVRTVKAAELYLVDGFTPGEAAKIMGMNQSAIKRLAKKINGVYLLAKELFPSKNPPP